jgi:galactose mutarotase-like enzyme
MNSDGLTARIDPLRGGKIVSLRDSTGYEWLSPPPEPRDYSGLPFVESEMCGWDECAPTITACRLDDGRALPDHGDLWDVAWRVEGDTLTARGRSMDYTFSRRTSTIERGLRFDYSVTAGAQATPFLWAAHPQFLAPAGSSIEVAAARVIDVLADEPEELVPTPGLLSIDSIEPGGCRKLYVSPAERVASAALVVPGHGRLELSWDAAVVPYVGLWFDAGCYARTPVIAIEPSTGYFDSLVTAIEQDRVLTIDPHTTVSWFVEVRVA